MAHKYIFSLCSYLFLLSTGILQGADLISIKPITNKIVLAHFDDGHIDYYKFGEEQVIDNRMFYDTLDVTKACDVTSYLVYSPDDKTYAGGLNPISIGRKSKGADFHSPFVGSDWTTNSWDKDGDSDKEYIREHWIYLELPHSLEQGKEYTFYLNQLANNATEFKFVFDARVVRSPTIHVSHLGFIPESNKFGYLSQWMGDFNYGAHSDGGLDLAEYVGKKFHLFSVNDLSTMVFSGEVTKRSDKNLEENTIPDDYNGSVNYSRSYVYECDFSAFTMPGKYILVVEEMGCSYPFEINNDVYRQAYYISSKGLFFQRQGIVQKWYNDVVYPRDHHPDDSHVEMYYDANFKFWQTPDHNLPDFDFSTHPVEGIWGHYHDAGDWDYYGSTHWAMPTILMALYELNPERFTDGDVKNLYKLANDSAWIEEGKNGLPDVLDEARWLLDFERRAKNALIDQGYGTGGVPDYVGREGTNGQTSWTDSRPIGVSAESPVATYNYAAHAAQFAYCLKVYNENGGDVPQNEIDDWYNEAEAAYIRAGSFTGTYTNDKLLAAVCLYKANGNTVYQDFIKNNLGASWAVDIAGSIPKNTMAGLLYGIIPSDSSGLDVSFHSAQIAYIEQVANNKETSMEDFHAFRLPWKQNYKPGLGRFSTMSCIYSIFAHKLTGDQNFLNTIVNYASYISGGNELNTFHTEGIGHEREYAAFTPDAWALTDYNSPVYRNRSFPGITTYLLANSSWVKGIGDERWSKSSAYPYMMDESDKKEVAASNPWPMTECRFYNRNSINGSEFTVAQTILRNVLGFGYLCSIPDGSFKPDSIPTVNLTIAENSDFDLGQKHILTATASENTAYVKYYYDWHYIGKSKDKINDFSFDWDVSQSNLKAGDQALITAVAISEKGESSVPTDGGDKMINIIGEVKVLDSLDILSSELILDEGQSQQVIVIFYPEDAQQELLWTSSDVSVATVSNGIVKGIEAGNAVIKVVTVDGNHIDSCLITVNSVVHPVTAVKTDPASRTIPIGESFQLTAIVSPAEATNKTVYWSSENEAIATVDSNGLVSAVSEGTTSITITTDDGGFYSMCTITVVPNIAQNLPVSWWTFENSPEDIIGDADGTLENGAGYTTNAKEGSYSLALDGTTQRVNLSNVDGGFPSGNAAFTFAAWVYRSTASNNLDMIFNYGTNNTNQNLCVKSHYGRLRVGSFADYFEWNGYFPIGTWVHLVVTYDGTTIRAYKNGVLSNQGNKVLNIVHDKAYIGTDLNGGNKFIGNLDDVMLFSSALSDTEVAAIYAGNSERPIEVESIRITTDTLSLNSNESAQLTAYLTPYNAYNQNISWNAANVDILTVVNGLVTVNNLDQTPLPTSIAINATESDLYVSDSLLIETSGYINLAYSTEVSTMVFAEAANGLKDTAIINVVYGTYRTIELTNRNVTFHSSDENIATIAHNGWIHTHDSGSVTITATAFDGTKTTINLQVQLYSLTVNTNNGTVTINPDKDGYYPGEEVTLTAIADDGYVFTNWSGDVAGTEETKTITIEGNTNINALFSKQTGVSTHNEAGIKIFPNPATKTITIDVTGNIAKISMANAFGQIIGEYTNLSSNNRIDVGQLQAGVYFIIITDTKGTKFSTQFLKQ